MAECPKCSRRVDHDATWGWLHEQIADRQTIAHRVECPVVPDLGRR